MNAPTPLATAELSDAHPDAQVCEPGLRDFGGKRAFHGRIATVHAPQDNSQVRALLETPGDGRVLVVDGEGGTTCALLGDQLGALAVKNGWSGVVVFGLVRDADALSQLPLGVKALGTHPRKSEKRGRGACDKTVRFLGVTFEPGHWLCADSDGVLVLLDPSTAIERG
jgi:regulator of ribonuclease activity A